MQQLYLHKKFYQIKKIDEREYSPEAYERYDKIRLFYKLREENCSEKTALEAIKVSRPTFFRWIKSYKIYNLAGLERQSRRPNNVRKPKWTSKTEELVLAMRKKYPLWGKEKIAVMIKRTYNQIVSASTVGRIIKKFVAKGKLKPVTFYYGKKEKRRRLFNGHAQQWVRGMKSKMPGELVQIDHMDIKLINGAHVKHFQAICPITKIAVEQAYNRATSDIASNFLQLIIQQMPFKVQSLQVDGGSEFMGEFEKACQKATIDLYVLPPRSPEYNGHVERCNATAKYEFYYQYNGSNALHNIQKRLQEHVKLYNSVRPHQGLSYLTPLEYYGQIRT